MFGLIKMSEHKRCCENLYSHIKHYGDINKKYAEEIKYLKEQLKSENQIKHDCQTVSCCSQREYEEEITKLLNDGYEMSSSSCNSSRDWKAILVK